jgi:hypothetical protein
MKIAVFIWFLFMRQIDSSLDPKCRHVFFVSSNEAKRWSRHSCLENSRYLSISDVGRYQRMQSCVCSLCLNDVVPRINKESLSEIKINGLLLLSSWC